MPARPKPSYAMYVSPSLCVSSSSYVYIIIATVRKRITISRTIAIATIALTAVPMSMQQKSASDKKQ